MEVNGTIFVQIIIFVSLLLWLSRSLFAPILRLFDEREKRIVGAGEEALRLNALADEKAKAFETEYQRAKDDARHVLSDLRLQMEREHQEILRKAKASAREKMEQAEVELKKEEEEVRKKLTATNALLADEIVSVLLKKNIYQPALKHESLVKEAG